MEKILKIPVTDRILLLKEIRGNWLYYKGTWTEDKVNFLHESIIRDINNLGIFNL